jgi:hypothetical protein
MPRVKLRGAIFPLYGTRKAIRLLHQLLKRGPSIADLGQTSLRI